MQTQYIKGVKTDKDDPKSAASVGFADKVKTTLETQANIVRGAIVGLNTAKLSNPTIKNLSMNSHIITALVTDKNEGTSPTNADYFKKHVHTASISRADMKDVFQYLMGNVNESSSENDISVSGISDFAGFPHQVNKKAYDITFTVDSDYEFRSRLGLNKYWLPMGEYTFVAEYFLPDKPHMDKATLSAASTTIKVRQHSSKTFASEGYARNIMNLHKWQVSPPEYLMLDMQRTISPGGGGGVARRASHCLRRCWLRCRCRPARLRHSLRAEK